jgi:hypothetical protein
VAPPPLLQCGKQACRAVGNHSADEFASRLWGRVPRCSVKDQPTVGKCQLMRHMTGAVHSGQEVINPDHWPVLLAAGRCHVASSESSSSTARYRGTGGRGSPGSCSGSTRSPRVQPRSLEWRAQLAPRVPSDALAGRSGAADQRETSDAGVLEVRRTFEASRLGSASLAAAYAQVVPGHQRRVGVAAAASMAPAADARSPQAVGASGGIRDV